MILCFSSLKYVHLNFGDLGVKALFLKAFDQLEPNGMFIVEAQFWRSYKKKKSFSERTKTQYAQIKIRPHLFKTYLQMIGFEHFITLMPEKDKQTGEFERPIMVFKKTAISGVQKR